MSANQPTKSNSFKLLDVETAQPAYEYLRATKQAQEARPSTTNSEFIENVQRNGPKVYNILLLGETGVGKSTIINSIASYLKYDSFEAAKSGELVNLIPARFNIFDVIAGKTRVIQHGKDSNELGSAMSDESTIYQSNTLSPRTYTFTTDQGQIRIIDTPGMGDTSGAPVDEENFEEILDHLLLYKELHGICILLKNTENRATSYFKYCITELFTHLHNSACDNLLFCFTNSRNSNYRPNDSYANLAYFLKAEFGNAIPLNITSDDYGNQNCFFFDNETYRFLVALKHNVGMEFDTEEAYRKSWNKSAEATKLLLERVRTNKPHNLRDTHSLNNARKIIFELADPMVSLQGNIAQNIEKMQETEKQIASKHSNIEKAKSLRVEMDILEAQELAQPMTVCNEYKCVAFSKDNDGKVKLQYKNICHLNCKRNTVPINIIGYQGLKKCWAFRYPVLPTCWPFLRENCRVCGCNWSWHMHVQFEYVKVKKLLIDPVKRGEITNESDAVERIKATQIATKNIIEELKQECTVIQDIASKFACLLVKNSFNPFNQYLEPYLDMQITEERRKVCCKGYSRAKLDVLLEIQRNHKKKVDILSKAIENNPEQSIKLNEIDQYVNQLYALQHTGSQFRQIIKCTHTIKENAAREEMENARNRGLDLVSKGLISKGTDALKRGIGQLKINETFNPSGAIKQQLKTDIEMEHFHYKGFDSNPNTKK